VLETAELDKPFPCLICGKRLETSCSDHGNASDVVTKKHGVHYGIPFHTSGAYGSQILDDSGEIHFVICDVCLLQRRHRILGNDRYDEDLKEGHHNGLRLYEKWLKYIESSGSYWMKIKEGLPLAGENETVAIVNGVSQRFKEDWTDYETLVKMIQGNPDDTYTITYKHKLGGGNLSRGGRVLLSEDIIFNVMITGQA
jgi:transcription elongation factor Elf1